MISTICVHSLGDLKQRTGISFCWDRASLCRSTYLYPPSVTGMCYHTWVNCFNGSYHYPWTVLVVYGKGAHERNCTHTCQKRMLRRLFTLCFILFWGGISLSTWRLCFSDMLAVTKPQWFFCPPPPQWCKRPHLAAVGVGIWTQVLMVA